MPRQLHDRSFRILLLVALAGCARDDAGPIRGAADGDADPTDASLVSTGDTAGSSTSETDHRIAPTEITDLAAVSGIDPVPEGERTRAMVAADFDNDGMTDLFVGNPGDRSYILRNRSTPGAPSFEVAQVLSDGHISWTAAAADYDNDGDVDLVVGGGGNECGEIDQLWQNQLMETGQLRFVDVFQTSGLSMADYGFPADADLIPTGGVRWLDVDLEGWLDLYVTHTDRPRCGRIPTEAGEVNELFRNVGGRFVRITDTAGLGGGSTTRHPSILDYDNDGDPDIFDSNLLGDNVLWHNMFAETGEIVFGQVTETGADLTYAERAFASCAEDLNNDGWEDLVVLNRAATECIVDEGEYANDGYEGAYHGVYLNNRHGFNDATEAAGVKVQVPSDTVGVMGCQVGDVNGDGQIDIFVGNGGPQGAGRNDLYLGTPGATVFADASHAVRGGMGDPKAYRTHGSVITDIDGDGRPELIIGNGGPSAFEGTGERTQLLQFEWEQDNEYLRVDLRGDGEHVNRDAIGSRVELVFALADGSTRSVHRAIRGGNCFSASNGPALFFGLGRGATELEAGTPTLLRIGWPDGTRSEHAVSVEPKTSDAVVITYPG